MNQLFTLSDLLTFVPGVLLIVCSVGIIGKGRIANAFKSLKSFLFLLAVLSLTSCVKAHDFNPYSPLDSYVKATTASYNSNLKAENDAKNFIDSLNNSHK